MTDRIVIGTRGSKLALVQAEWVRQQLQRKHPGIDTQLEIIRTTGDVKPDPLSVIGGKGVFTKELEDALGRRQIDVAVHSLKDLPTIIGDDLQLTAICEREDARDALILPATAENDVSSLSSLPHAAIVGTSSPRRVAQLQNIRPDLVVKDLRGNVDTRLRKLDEGQCDALILASAGLRRLGLTQRINLHIAIEQMLPAVGQGAIGLQTRADDARVNDIVSQLNHDQTGLACTAERALLRALGGGCQLPIAAHATIVGSELTLDGLVASRDGSNIIRDRIAGAAAYAQSLGNELGALLLAQGAAQLL